MRLILLFIYSLSTSALAYEEITHESLSTEALKASMLADTNKDVLVNLGLKSELFDELVQKFTNNNPNGDNEELSINGLIRSGARFEDDKLSERSLHHFFDPYHDRPIDIPGLSVFRDPITSPDWAIEDVADTSAQDYSYKDATNYFFLALTSQTEQERNTNWGLMFQSLGQVIHHIQDMSQPQHVRNDDHCNLGVWGCIFRHDPSVYERYTGKNIASTIPSYITLDYPIPAFTTAREYWTTPDNRGIADFTNLNFFSKDTNFQYNNGAISPSAEYQKPIPDLTPIPRNISDADLLGATRGQALCNELKDAYILGNPPTGDCYIDFIQTTVTDALNPGLSSNNQKAASLSIFDDELATYNSTILFEEDDGDIVSIDRRPSLNEFNFKSAHEYLIPRAVAYSAGLINYFFKAEFEVTVNDAQDMYVIRNLSGHTMSGMFSLYTAHKYENNRELITQWNVNALANGDVVEVLIPDLKSYSLYFKIVFRGQLDSALNTEEFIYSYTLDSTPRTSIGTASDISTSTGYTLDRQFTFTNNYKTYTYKSEIHNGVMTQYSWSRNSSTGTCVFEYLGSIAKSEAFPGTGDFSDAFYNSNGPYVDAVRLPITAPLIGTIPVPGPDDCEAASYGYRSMLWSNGYISKYVIGFTSGYNIYLSGSYTSFNLALTDDNYFGLMTDGLCSEALLSNVNPAWPNTKSMTINDLTEANVATAYLLANVPALVTRVCRP